MAIVGFKVFVSGSELRAHLATRANYHDERAKWYADNEAKVAESPTAMMTNDPVKAMQEAGRRHTAKADLFRFFVAHIPEGETYELSTSDTDQLELTSGARGY
jgi:hypothetical protein